MSDTRPEPTGPAGDAPTYTPKPAAQAPAGPVVIGEPIRILRGTVTGIDAHGYTVSVKMRASQSFWASHTTRSPTFPDSMRRFGSPSPSPSPATTRTICCWRGCLGLCP